MPSRKSNLLIPLGLGMLLVAGLLFFWPVQSASAQCGSQASSCKNCHEVQAQDAVNSDGTSWHTGHSFGDFCTMCHAGNPQSPELEGAHTGMVPPLSDAKASCVQCHPDDYLELAQGYATTLGVELGTGGGAAPSDGATTTSGEAAMSDTSAAEAPPAIVVGEAEVVDYNRQYDETVLGRMTINWGNVVVGVMIVVIAAGGGAFAYWNERRLRGGFAKKPAPVQAGAVVELPVVEGFSPEVVALLPLIAKLDPVGLHALKKLLANPDQASELLHSLSHMDPELLRRMRNLDRDSRALLMALAGD